MINWFYISHIQLLVESENGNLPMGITHLLEKKKNLPSVIKRHDDKIAHTHTLKSHTHAHAFIKHVLSCSVTTFYIIESQKNTCIDSSFVLFYRSHQRQHLFSLIIYDRYYSTSHSCVYDYDYDYYYYYSLQSILLWMLTTVSFIPNYAF